MPWDTITDRISGPTRLPVSVRLRPHKEGGRPACIVSLRSFFAAGLSWKSGDDIGVQVGRDEHAGKLRLVRNMKPAIAKLRGMVRGGFGLDLGHLSALGEDACEKAGAAATIIDGDTVEITLPAWTDAPLADADEDDEVDEAPEVETRAPPQIAQTPPSAKPAGKPNGSGHMPPFSKDGMTVHFDSDAERIEHAGAKIEVTTNQAKFLAALLVGSPNPIDKSFLVRKIYGTASTAHELGLAQIVTDLTKMLPEVGLVLKNVKGVGFALQVKE